MKSRVSLINLLWASALLMSACCPLLVTRDGGVPISVRILAGTTETLILKDVSNARQLKAVRLVHPISGKELASGRLRTSSVSTDDSVVQVTIEAHTDTEAKTYRGTLLMLFGSGFPNIARPATIAVHRPTDDVIPLGVRTPSIDRIVRDKDGQLLVKDELVVMLPIFAPSILDSVPADTALVAEGRLSTNAVSLVVSCKGTEEQARTRSKGTDSEGNRRVLAAPMAGTAERAVCDLVSGKETESNSIFGGQFIGWIPQTRTFQMRFPDVKDIDQLVEKRRLILSQTSQISAVSRSFVAEHQPVMAPDVVHNASHGVTSNAAIYSRVKVPEAWNFTTGNSGVTVAVIDCDFSENHPDLGTNVFLPITGNRTLNCFQHGTSTAGIIGATSSSSGIAGLAWTVNMRLYDYLNGSKVEPSTNIAVLKADIALPAALAMASAIDADLAARPTKTLVGIVNRAWHDGPTGSAATADETNAILNQSILYGLKKNKEVLWVFPAGNEARDARTQSPAGLTWWYPVDTITVANVDVTGGVGVSPTLHATSNRGYSVTVGAPGQGLWSTADNSTGGHVYQQFGGTSAAAPFVAGLGALVLSKMENDIVANVIADDWPAWKVKDCIVGGADFPISGITNFKLINSERAIPRVGAGGSYDCNPMPLTFPANRNIDIVFAIDTSGSMSQEINVVKSQAEAILNKLRNAFPSSGTTHLRFGLVTYEDYVNPTTASSCPPLSATYGFGGDKPYRVLHTLTDQIGSLIPVLRTQVHTLSGGDLPESYGRVFWEIAKVALNQPDPSQSIPLGPFAANALKIIINFGDDFPHDDDLNGSGLNPNNGPGCTATDPDGAGPNGGLCKYDILNPTFQAPFPGPGGVVPNTGRDPGRNGILGCTANPDADDIDFQADALRLLENQKIRLIHIDSSGQKAKFAPYWATWTRGTKGAYVPINSDGTIPQGLDLASLLLQIVIQVANTPD